MKQIARIMQWLVPIMALAWVMTSVGIGIAHFRTAGDVRIL
jgi:AGCS family alanine or glycine:cation symporter